MIDLFVVGAGPAGLAAARRAGELGLRVVVADENPEAGGQYYRQPALPDARLDARQRQGRAKIDAAAEAAELRLGCSVYALEAVDGGWRVWVEQAGVAERVEAAAILLSTGASDAPVAFPGWTLPGVLSAGAAQTLVKSQAVRPGRRAIVAGSGPFLLVVAAQLRAAGMHVLEVAEATSVRRAARFVPASLRNPGRYGELARLALPLLGAGVPLRRGTIVVAAEGGDRLEAVRLRDEWTHGAGRERVVEADVLCVGYGFSASTELARLAACALAWDAGLGQLVPAVDEWQAASQPGVFVAGEACGLAGADVAAAEGELAAIGAARAAGRLSETASETAAKPLRRRLRSLRRFASLLPRIFVQPAELGFLAAAETTVCRCENVSLGRVVEAVDESGASNLNELKTVTRCGQGWCQGRVCGAVIPRALVASGRDFDPLEPMTARNPIRPIQLAAIAALDRQPEADG